MNFELSLQAQQALAEVWDYYAKRGGARLSDRILADVHDAILRLTEFPGLGHY